MGKKIDPRFGATFGIVVSAAFVVVLAVSLAALGWSGPGAYVRVMVTLGVSLLVMTAAALGAAWVVAKREVRTDPSDKILRIRRELDTETDPSEKIQRIRKELGAKTDPSDEILRIRQELDAGIGPSDEILRIRKELDVMRNCLKSLVREAVEQADRERAVRHESDKGAK